MYFDKRDIDFSEEPLYQITWCHISGCTNVPANIVPNLNVSDSPECVLNLFQMKPARCTLSLGIFISISLHVSGNYVPVIRRTYCIYATFVFFTLYGYCAGGKIEKNEMGGACGAYGGGERCAQGSSGEN